LPGKFDWPQLDAVYEHELTYARSQKFYDTTISAFVELRRARRIGSRQIHKRHLGRPILADR
jgi:hypothetical protein